MARRTIEVEYDRSVFGSKAEKVICKLDVLLYFHKDHPELIARSIKKFQMKQATGKLFMRLVVEDRV